MCWNTIKKDEITTNFPIPIIKHKIFKKQNLFHTQELYLIFKSK